MAPKPTKVQVATIVRHDGPIVLPPTMSYDNAIDVIQRQKVAEEQIVGVDVTFNAFPWDGARALKIAMERKWGAVLSVNTPGFFGDNPPSEITIDVDFAKTERIIWGRFKLPGLDQDDEFVQTVAFEEGGQWVFKLVGRVRRKFRDDIDQLATVVREVLATDSIYRGKAFRLAFIDGEAPKPTFLDLSKTDLSQIIYSDSIQRALDTNVYTLLKHSAEAKRMGVPLKRGVLLAGEYGTGKTLAAYATARYAVENKWTFIYLPSAADLAAALRFSVNYGPAVVFVEDIDRTTSGERTASLDELLNQLDGVDTKGVDVMVVMTTNHLSKINPAMLRPGRLDVVLEILAPDQNAVQRLIRVYAGAMLDANADTAEIGKMLAGQIPATIREVVERSKLEYLRRTSGGNSQFITLIPDDITYAAQTVLAQRALTKPQPPEVKSNAQVMGEALGEGASTGIALGFATALKDADVRKAIYNAARAT